jgi:hypothetical protein
MATLFNTSGCQPILQYAENNGETPQLLGLTFNTQQKYWAVFPQNPAS